MESKPVETATVKVAAPFSFLRKLWSEAWVLAVMPFAGYYFAYRHELGFCRAFNVPEYLIEVDLGKVIEFTGAIVGFSWFALIIAQTISIFSAFGNTGLLFKRYWPYGLGLLITAMFLPTSKSVFLLVVSICVASVLSDVLHARRVGNPTKTFIQNLVDAPQVTIVTSPLYFLYQRAGPVIFLLFVITYFGSSAARFLGRALATNRTEFFVLGADTNVVVIQKYGDRLVCVRIDNDKKITSEVTVLPAATEAGLKLERRSIGPLKLD